MSYAAWQSNYFGSTNAANAAQRRSGRRRREELSRIPHQHRSANKRHQRLESFHRLQQQSGAGDHSQVANRAVEVQATTNLLNSNSWARSTCQPMRHSSRNQPHYHRLRTDCRDAEILSRPAFPNLIGLEFCASAVPVMLDPNRLKTELRTDRQNHAGNSPHGFYHAGNEFVQVPSPPRHGG